MLNSKSLKITFATLFASLTLMLSLFATTGIASAHSANAAQSKASTSQSAEQKKKDRDCVLIIREHVIFVPFQNLWWNNQWNSWGRQFANQDRDFTINASDFDANQWHFNNFDRRDRDRFAGFFIVKVTEILKCHGHVVKVHTFTFIER